MSQYAENAVMVNETLESAISIGCTMVSRSKQVRKKLNSSADDKTSVKKSLKELDRMSIELIDKLVEINARIDLPVDRNNTKSPKNNRLGLFLKRFMSRFRKRIENMKLTYQDMYTL